MNFETAMNSNRKCPKCGAELAEGALEGLCPKCASSQETMPPVSPPAPAKKPRTKWQFLIWSLVLLWLFLAFMELVCPNTDMPNVTGLRNLKIAHYLRTIKREGTSPFSKACQGLNAMDHNARSAVPGLVDMYWHPNPRDPGGRFWVLDLVIKLDREAALAIFLEAVPIANPYEFEQLSHRWQEHAVSREAIGRLSAAERPPPQAARAMECLYQFGFDPTAVPRLRPLLSKPAWEPHHVKLAVILHNAGCLSDLEFCAAILKALKKGGMYPDCFSLSWISFLRRASTGTERLNAPRAYYSFGILVTGPVARAAKEAEPYLEPLLTKPEWEGYHLDLAAALYRMDERHGAQLLTALIAKLKKAESWFCSYWDWDDFMDFLRQKGPEARVAAPYLEQLMERPKWAEFDRDRTRIAQPLLDIDPTNVKALRFILKSLQAQSTSSNPAIRSGAKERLAKLRPLAPSQVKELLRLAGDPSLRDTAHRILLNLGTDALPGLRQAAEDADEPIRKEAAAMIEAITNPPK